MLRTHRLPHVGALDGLRAVALIAVLLYHQGFSWAQGGFLGVSTFFTLSGFLITSLLLVQYKDNGTISLRRFWSARVRRLLPAALVTLVLVVAFARFAASPTQLTGLRGDLLSSFALATNWRLAFSGSEYGAYLTNSSPVQHIWSLAVEEQFYLLLPTLLVVVCRGARRPQNRLALVAGALALGSTAALVTSVGPDGQTNLAYYATYNRAAELLAGVVAACVAHHLVGWRYRDRVVPAVGGLGLVVLAAAWVVADQRSASLYRGGITIYTLASVAVIVSILQPGPLTSALSNKTMQWLGRVSYSAYLYHWPIFLWLTPQRVGLDGIALFAIRTALTLALAGASTALLERPIRLRVVLRNPGTAPVVGIVVMALALVAVVPSNVVDTGPSGVRVESGERVASASPKARTTTLPAAVGVDTTAPKPTVKRLLLVGDSIIHQASPYFAEQFPTVDVRWIGGDGIGPLTDQGRVVDTVAETIGTFDPDVVLVEFAGSYLKRRGGAPYVNAAGQEVEDGSDEMFAAWEQQMAAIVGAARADGAKVLVALTPTIDPNGYFSYLSEGVSRLNQIYEGLADVSIVDWYGPSASGDSGYASILTENGRTEVARSPDGLHFTEFGYRVLADVAAPTIEAYPGRVLPAG